MFNRTNSRNPDFDISRRRRLLSKFSLSRMKFTSLLLFSLGVSLLYMIFLSGVFQLKTVRFLPEQLGCVSADGVRELVPRGTNLLLIKNMELEAIIRAQYPCLEQVKVVKQFPDSLLIVTVERKAVALLRVGARIKPVVDLNLVEASESSVTAKPVVIKDDFKIDENVFNKTFSVDKEGFLLSNNPQFEDNLELLYFLVDKELVVGSMLDQKVVQNSLMIVNQLREREIGVEKAKIEGDSLYIIGPTKAIFSLLKDVKTQVVSLQLILQKAKMDSVVAEKIDLRFDKPIVVYSKKK